MDENIVKKWFSCARSSII